MDFRLTADEKDSFDGYFKKNAPQMQALLVRGFKSLPAARYLLLKIDDAALAKQYFAQLVQQNLIRFADKPEDKTQLFRNGDPKFAVNIAFTSSGLTKLGMPDKTLDTFSRQFIEGMSGDDPKAGQTGERSTLLGDRGDSDPKHWYWGNKNKPVHCLLMLFAADGNALQKLIASVYTNLQQGTSLAFKGGDTFEFGPGEELKEHFGFRDGISQPILWGLSKAEDPSIKALHKIKPGEVVLGMKNEYGHEAPSPYAHPHHNIDLGSNGSYLVFRQIEQHVEKFWTYLYNNSVETGVSAQEKAVRLGAKMIGRWPEGQPLVTCPEGECPTDPVSLNNFTYAEPDTYGLKCPFGAHIRRSNPRDQVHTGRDAEASLVMSRRHRMLRRGRIYGIPLAPNFNIEAMICKIKNPDANCSENDNGAGTSETPAAGPGQTKIRRGLHFICLVSDIGRQFEFVQNVWANTPTFADLRNESDPIISPKSAVGQLAVNEFTTPNDTIRNRYTVRDEFTTVVGGSYFFLPSLFALNYFIGYPQA